MAKNLVIVESPAKAKTIEKFLGKDFMVKSSFGHVMDLAKKDFGVDIKNGFIPNYEVSADKKKLVAELKKDAKAADMVWLASDEDREGEAIAWHLFNALNLKTEKTRRIVFHEITKPAILNAIENPRDIDVHLVNAQQARRVLDRLVGYEISPVLWRKVKPSLSAGRVQSVAVRLIVEKEEEIKAFVPVSAYRVIAKFLIDGVGTVLEAELPKRFATKEEARAFLETCMASTYKVDAVEKRPGKRSPAPPFTTSTLQQEASRKMGYGVSKTMVVAQQLYEAGYITYMRTDSVNLSKLAIAKAKEVITENYGAEYSKTRVFATKTKGAQEAHEAIRPTYLENKTIKGDSSQQKLYELIWKRTIASQMAEAKLEKTTINIEISKSPEKMRAQGEVITFEGFLKVYMESKDDDNDSSETKGMLPPLKNGQPLDLDCMMATEKYTKHSPRYSEASLVKKLEEQGIGRPSTYAPTISTVQKRGYVIKEDRDGLSRNINELRLSGNEITEAVHAEVYNAVKNKLLPTDIGTLVNKFLSEHFKDILDYQFTAKVEKEFDSIAEGKTQWNKMISDFYHPFKTQVDHTIETAEREKGERLLGIDPKSEKNVYARIGRFGPMVQIGEAEDEEKPRFASLKKGQSITEINLEEALELFKFPIKVGEIDGKVVNVAIGRFGPYVSHNKVFASIPKGEDPVDVDFDRAVELLEEKKQKDIEKFIKGFDEEPELTVLKGRWGPYIKFKKGNYKIAKPTGIKDKDKLAEAYLEKAKAITLEECQKLIKEQDKTKKKR